MSTSCLASTTEDAIKWALGRVSYRAGRAAESRLLRPSCVIALCTADSRRVADTFAAG
jgi:hypothetical protein